MSNYVERQKKLATDSIIGKYIDSTDAQRRDPDWWVNTLTNETLDIAPGDGDEAELVAWLVSDEDHEVWDIVATHGAASVRYALLNAIESHIYEKLRQFVKQEYDTPEF